MIVDIWSGAAFLSNPATKDESVEQIAALDRALGFPTVGNEAVHANYRRCTRYSLDKIRESKIALLRSSGMEVFTGIEVGPAADDLLDGLEMPRPRRRRRRRKACTQGTHCGSCTG